MVSIQIVAIKISDRSISCFNMLFEQYVPLQLELQSRGNQTKVNLSYNVLFRDLI